jgi:adenylosuccinate synthase
MPVTVVVGGQYGSEGKGKVTALLARRSNNPWLVRCGGPNSGHTVTIGDQHVVLRQVPACTDPASATFCIAAGCVIDEAILVSELNLLGIPPDRIVVDPRAIILLPEDACTEAAADLPLIGSTCSGTGAALARRMLRRAETLLASGSQHLALRCRVEPLAPLLHSALRHRTEVIVEGTQGFGLSLLHGPSYPFVTSRDTTASAFCAEAGLSPRLVDRIIMVVRTFPIRVGGPSGPLPQETTWEEIQAISGAPVMMPEFTSVTKRLRRVAHFDLEMIKLACLYNAPTALAVMGLDRLDFRDSGVTQFKDLTPRARHFLESLELATQVPVELAGTGFHTGEAVQVSLPALASLCHA